jgi:osmotically-inducible protein OsmY
MAKLSTTTAFVAGAASGAAAVYFLDPDSGNRRRAVTRDKATSTATKAAGQAAGQAKAAAQRAKGAVHDATPSVAEKAKATQLNDADLARKVETEIFRPADAPKGQVDVNVENGVVFLRGELGTTEEIDTLVEAANKVTGVKGVESLLHLPGQAAQTAVPRGAAGERS